MALPVGVTTATVIAGVPVSHTGAAVKSFLSIEPSVFLVHTATGTPLVDFLEELDISEGVAGQFNLPHTDQAGFQDENGNAYTNWYYTARITYSTPSKAKTKPPKIKVFQLPAGQTVVDLDRLPSGAPALPYTAPIATVTSVNGRTGTITIEDADLPERLSDTALTATILDQVEETVPTVLAADPTIAAAAEDAVTARVAAEDLLTGAAAAATYLSSAAANTTYKRRATSPVNMRDEGVVANGVVDDYAAMQAAIYKAIDSRRKLYIPEGDYRYLGTLLIPDHLEIESDGCGEVWNPVKTGAPIDYSSYFTATDLEGGTILRPAQAGWDAIRLTGRGKSVNLHGFGIRFADSIKFTNTGHAISVAPPANPYDATSKDHGLFGAMWSNLKVFGQDGNHYAYNLVNPLGCHFDNLNAFGGGAMRMFTDSSLFFYGNSTITNLYGAVIQAGTADGIYLGGNGSGVGGTIQLLEWHRPQIWMANITENVPGTTAPTNVQLMLNADPNRARRMSWIDPDFENNVNTTVRWPIEANKILNGAQAGTPNASNLVGPPTNPSNITGGTWYRNTQGCDILYQMNFKMNPDTTTDATAKVEISANGTTVEKTVFNQSLLKGGATGIPLSASFIIPAGYWVRLTTTRASWNDFQFQKVQY